PYLTAPELSAKPEFRMQKA
ncbi:hypothetical protein VCHENC02_5572B, partial [Vibrio harveyi]